MEFTRHNGYDWSLIERPADTPTLGMTIGYGMIHEPLEDYGALAGLAAAIEAELSRAVEVAPGRVSVPEVAVTPGTDTTSIFVRGDRETIERAWRRLAELFAGRIPLEKGRLQSVRFNGAPRDVTSRIGVTSLSLASSRDLGLNAPGDPEVLRARLDPAAGRVRCVMTTDDPELLGAAFAAPAVPPPTQPEPSRLSTAVQSGFYVFPSSYAVVSFVVPRTADGAGAVRAFAGQLAGHLPDNGGVSVAILPLGPDMLATMMTERPLTVPERVQVLSLLTARQPADRMINDAAAWERENATLARKRERQALGLAPELEATPDGVRLALSAARRTLRLFVEAGMEVPAGFERIGGAVEVTGGKKFHARALGDWLIVSDHAIRHVVKQTQHTDPDDESVDLDRLALVFEDSRGTLLLVDQEYRTLQIVSDAYRHEAQLRALLDPRMAAVPRIRAEDVTVDKPLRTLVKMRKRQIRFLIIAPFAVLAFAIVMSFLDDYI